MAIETWGIATWGREEDPGQVPRGVAGFSCPHVETGCPVGAVGMLPWAVPTSVLRARRSLLGHRSFLPTL